KCGAVDLCAVLPRKHLQARQKLVRGHCELLCPFRHRLWLPIRRLEHCANRVHEHSRPLHQQSAEDERLPTQMKDRQVPELQRSYVFRGDVAPLAECIKGMLNVVNTEVPTAPCGRIELWHRAVK